MTCLGVWCLNYECKLYYMVKENPFKKIYQPSKEVPVELRGKVLKEVATAKLLLDMASLFTSNYKSTFSTLFLAKKKKDNIN